MKKSGIIFAVACAIALAACSNTESTNSTQANTIAPKDQKPIATSVPMSTIANDFFQVSYANTWHIISQEGPHEPAFISLQKNDRSSLVTIRVSKENQDIETLCNGAALAIIANGYQLVTGPAIIDKTCVIEGISNEKPTTVWIKKFDKLGLSYSINYEGESAIANQVLSTLQGDKYMMELINSRK